MKQKKKEARPKFYGCRRILMGTLTVLLSIFFVPLILTSPELIWILDKNTRQFNLIPMPANKESDTIAFICSDYYSSLYTVYPDGSHLRKIRNNPMEMLYELSWAPDGYWLAAIVQNHVYIIWEEPKNEIYRIRFDGLDSKRLTYNHYREVSPYWSHDGRSITYISNQGIHRISADGEKMSLIDHRARRVSPRHPVSWSADGKVLMEDPNDSSSLLYSTNLDGFDLQTLKDIRISASDIQWAPNNEQFLVSTLKSVSVFNTKTKVADLTVNMRMIHDVRWSPNGKWIAISGNRYRHSGGLHILDVETGLVQEVNDGFIRHHLYDNSISWSPDGEWVAFIFNVPHSYKNQLFKIKRDGTALQQLTDLDCRVTEVSWSPK